MTNPCNKLREIHVSILTKNPTIWTKLKTSSDSLTDWQTRQGNDRTWIKMDDLKWDSTRWWSFDNMGNWKQIDIDLAQIGSLLGATGRLGGQLVSSFPFHYFCNKLGFKSIVYHTKFRIKHHKWNCQRVFPFISFQFKSSTCKMHRNLCRLTFEQ